MQSYESEIDDKTIVLLYQGEDKPVHLQVGYQDFDLIIIDDEFANPVIASAHLRSALTYQGACAFLALHGIPKSSQLWHLNHDGPPPDDGTN